MTQHDDYKRGFHRTSKAFYAKGDGEPPVKVYFGMYAHGRTTNGEMTMEWEQLNCFSVPRLKVYDDAWRTLATFTDLIQILGEHNDKDITEEEFVAILLSCGFEDLTPYEPPSRQDR